MHHFTCALGSTSAFHFSADYDTTIPTDFRPVEPSATARTTYGAAIRPPKLSSPANSSFPSTSRPLLPAPTCPCHSSDMRAKETLSSTGASWGWNETRRVQYHLCDCLGHTPLHDIHCSHVLHGSQWQEIHPTVTAAPVIPRFGGKRV